MVGSEWQLLGYIEALEESYEDLVAVRRRPAPPDAQAGAVFAQTDGSQDDDLEVERLLSAKHIGQWNYDLFRLWQLVGQALCRSTLHTSCDCCFCAVNLFVLGQVVHVEQCGQHSGACQRNARSCVRVCCRCARNVLVDAEPAQGIGCFHVWAWLSWTISP